MPRCGGLWLGGCFVWGGGLTPLPFPVAGVLWACSDYDGHSKESTWNLHVYSNVYGAR
jgi:hypothetical protein